MSVPLCSLWFIYTLLKVKSVSVSSFVIDDEPKCSKFDYDEKLLEKMIRLEHKNGLMIDTVKTFVADTERDITAIRQETEEMKQQVQYLHSRVNETLHGGLLENRQNTEELDARLEKLETKVEHQLPKLNTTVLTNMETFLQKQGYQAAFTAWNPTAGPDSGTLTFSTVLTNIGGQYDATTGKFTCKRPGLYYFSLSLSKKRTSSRGEADRVNCFIRHNGVNKIRAYTDPKDDSTDEGGYEAGNSIILHLNAGDTVDLGSCYTTYTAYGSDSSFSGFLLHHD